MATKSEINEYLYSERCGDLRDDESASISEDSPFVLRYLDAFSTRRGRFEVFDFLDDGERFYVVSGPVMYSRESGSTTIEDIRLAMIGSEWLDAESPIDLNTVRLGDPSVPPTKERRASIERLADGLFSTDAPPMILEGLFLRGRNAYLALVQDPSGNRGAIVSTLAPHYVIESPDQAGRSLRYWLGRMIDEHVIEPM